ncbi:hypothetical protein [Mycobacterium spongiae]|uniref:Uncharacterized protein n=1 Tax=Mycobacterium spongiae TaxID=886343 RepID=A0A975K0B1_9MYCO|nr:hypothetical protein [Mycobacterium spongiae]QUR69015.1 hypothetical protein F6B93_19820 [Mycobacterium spongiae]
MAYLLRRAEVGFLGLGPLVWLIYSSLVNLVCRRYRLIRDLLSTVVTASGKMLGE